jgi:hypothetical protein
MEEKFRDEGEERHEAPSPVQRELQKKGVASPQELLRKWQDFRSSTKRAPRL